MNIPKFCIKLLKLFNSNHIGLARLSTALNPSEIHLSSFRTTQHDPNNHSEDHLAQFYTISPEIQKQLFSTGGLPKQFVENVNTFGECSIMIRHSAVEIMNYLKKTDYSKPAIRYVLYSRNKGSGKSLILAHLLHFAWTRKMILIHVPWASNWTNRARDNVPSVKNPEYIDSPYNAITWLQGFKNQNLELLNELNLETTQTYDWSKREATEKGKPLLDIIEHGLNRAGHASDCIAALLSEIKSQSESGKFKAFVAVDGLNAFFVPSRLKRADKTLVEPEKFTIIEAFLNLLDNDWTNAAVVVTVDPIAARTQTQPDDFTPMKLLGKKGFELLEPFVPMEIPKYSRKEIISCLDYYIDRNWLQNPLGRTDKGKEELIFLSGSIPYDLMSIVAAR